LPYLEGALQLALLDQLEVHAQRLDLRGLQVLLHTAPKMRVRRRCAI
jgi:hypothetical protein